MSDTTQILVVDDGVLKYYKGNNPDIIKKALDVERSIDRYDTVFIKDDKLLPEKRLGSALKSVKISAEIPWSTSIFRRNIFEFVPRISVDKENENYTVIDGNLYSKDGKILARIFADKPKDVILADGTTECLRWAFYKRKINRLYLPESMQSKLSLIICINSSYIDVDANNPLYTSINGNLYSKDGKTLVRYAIGKEETEFIVPDGVEKIGVCAFEGASIEKITMAAGVTTIERHAFDPCNNLKDVSIPDSIEHIAIGAFYNCPNIKYYKENGHKYLGNKLSPKLIFVKPKNRVMESFEIDHDTKIILYNAFSECRKMKSVFIPNGVSSIGEWAFNECRSLQRINLPDSVEEIGDWVFSSCVSLEEVNLSQNLKKIEELVFYSCSKLARIVVPKSITHIDEHACITVNPEVVFVVSKGSYAEQYAKTHNIQVDDIDSAKIVPTACEVCGTVLMKDSGFCHKCGAKVVAKPFVSIE